MNLILNRPAFSLVYGSIKKTEHFDKKLVSINSNIKNEGTSSLISKGVNIALARICSSAKLLILYKINKITQAKVDKRFFHTKTSYVYKFTCICLSDYNSWRERRAFPRFIVHVPEILVTSERTILKSVITKHVMDSRYQVNSWKVFNVINKQPNCSLPKFAETFAISRQ